ncbi:MAG: DNA/RNA nuclease SfsA [Rhodobacteraceae bacterium]|nr:DNA/RNA nuclease SfsA [Paracoccaceae bacterium]
MRFPTPLVPARLIRRYKRFLADMELESGHEVTAHCANPGSMLGLKQPGMRCWLEPNDDPKKKLKFGWRLIDHENGHFTGVDTTLPNRMLRAALTAHQVPELAAWPVVRPEVKYGQKSRVDFLLTGDGMPDAYVEVKSVTLSRSPGLAEFPDSVTTRGARHMDELAAMASQGHRAVVFFLVQRADCTHVRVAEDIDPAYAAAFTRARAAGVELLSYDCKVSPKGVSLGRPIPAGA